MPRLSRIDWAGSIQCGQSHGERRRPTRVRSANRGQPARSMPQPERHRRSHQFHSGGRRTRDPAVHDGAVGNSSDCEDPALGLR